MVVANLICRNGARHWHDAIRFILIFLFAWSNRWRLQPSVFASVEPRSLRPDGSAENTGVRGRIRRRSRGTLDADLRVCGAIARYDRAVDDFAGRYRHAISSLAPFAEMKELKQQATVCVSASPGRRLCLSITKVFIGSYGPHTRAIRPRRMPRPEARSLRENHAEDGYPLYPEIIGPPPAVARVRMPQVQMVAVSPVPIAHVLARSKRVPSYVVVAGKRSKKRAPDASDNDRSYYYDSAGRRETHIHPSAGE